MKKKISKEEWTGYNAFTMYAGDLEEAEKFYISKNINLPEGFYKGWKRAEENIKQS